MKCLVTGGLGFVGSHVVDALVEAGHKVTILDDLSTGSLDNLNPKAKFVEDDIEYIDLVPPVDVVFHLAALARIQPSLTNTAEYHRVNLTGTLAVLEYCKKHSAKIIYSGSSSTYSGEDVPARESSLQKATNPYTLQKLTSEAYIKLYSGLFGTEWAILRYFNVYGERQLLTGDYAALVGIFMEQKNSGKPLTIYGDGEQRRDFTYVKDVAKANLMAIDWDGEFNIGTGINYSVNELAEFVGGKKSYLFQRKGEVREVLADNSKARSKGWKPTKDIKQWIGEQYDKHG